jgi:hypothetical protein
LIKQPFVVFRTDARLPCMIQHGHLLNPTPFYLEVRTSDCKK